MPRFNNIEETVFQDPNGRGNVRIKLKRPILNEPIGITIKLKMKTDLDEVASRPDVFGPGGEPESYRLFDANIVALGEAEFDMGKIRELRIPA
jgi:hypothetical protein